MNPSTSLRVWPAIVIVVLQWAAIYVPGWLAPGTMLAGFGMMFGPLVGFLLLAIWWLLASRAPWKEKLISLGALLAIYVAVMVLSDSTIRMAAFVIGMPLACTAFALVATLMRQSASSPRIKAMAVGLLVACGLWLFLRSDGVDGDMSQQYAFRWSATHEEKLAGLASAGIGTSREADESHVLWAGFRGANRDGVATGVQLSTDWAASPPEVVWRKEIGPGWSSFAVAAGCLYTQEQRDDDEYVVCYDPNDGEPRWVHKDSARFYESMAGAGPRATPTYHEGRIYTFGATGILNALDATDGTLLWSRDAAEDSGAKVPDWGFSSSPLVVDGKVVVHTGALDGKAVAAYDVGDGSPLWFADAGAISYSSVHLATIEETPQLLILSDAGLAGIHPDTGETLWEHDWPLEGMARVVQPAVLDDGSVLIGSGFGIGLRKIRVNKDGNTWSTEELWTSRGISPYYNDFVVHEGHLYGFDGRIMAALNLETGDRVWKGGRYGNGQVLLLPEQDLLLVLSDRGDVALVKADPAGFEELGKVSAIDGKTWNHPVIADGMLYVRNGEEMAALRLRSGQAR